MRNCRRDNRVISVIREEIHEKERGGLTGTLSKRGEKAHREERFSVSEIKRFKVLKILPANML